MLALYVTKFEVKPTYAAENSENSFQRPEKSSEGLGWLVDNGTKFPRMPLYTLSSIIWKRFGWKLV